MEETLRDIFFLIRMNGFDIYKYKNFEQQISVWMLF